MVLRWQSGLAAVLYCWCSLISAAGLQVAPVTLTIPPSQNAEGLWLSNTGDGQVNAQVRVFRWTQEDGEDKLTPTRELLVSPPMLQLPLEGRQFIRAIRAQAPPSGPDAVQAAYRLLIDELPLDTPGRKGLQFVVRHSVPVFVQPVGPAPAPPRLDWKLLAQGDRAVLQVSNSGASHAQLADLMVVEASGRETIVHAGLLGYVLPGAQMRWTLKLPVAEIADGPWKAMINGTTVLQDVTRAEKAP